MRVIVLKILHLAAVVDDVDKDAAIEEYTASFFRVKNLLPHFCLIEDMPVQIDCSLDNIAVNQACLLAVERTRFGR